MDFFWFSSEIFWVIFDMYGYAAGGSGRRTTMVVGTVGIVDTVDTVDRTKGDLAVGSHHKLKQWIVLYLCTHYRVFLGLRCI